MNETGSAHKLAQDAGFIVWSLRDAYRPYDKADIRLAEWDEHPNSKGHELLAAGLYDLMTAPGDPLGLGLHSQRLAGGTTDGNGADPLGVGNAVAEPRPSRPE